MITANACIRSRDCACVTSKPRHSHSTILQHKSKLFAFKSKSVDWMVMNE